jgi:hypothetical protein
MWHLLLSVLSIRTLCLSNSSTKLMHAFQRPTSKLQDLQYSVKNKEVWRIPCYKLSILRWLRNSLICSRVPDLLCTIK